MSRFTQSELQEIYGANASYTLPRFVTMITQFDPVVTEKLFPMTVVRPLAAFGNHQTHQGVKWVKVRAFRNPKDYSDGWIPKSVLHDFAFAALQSKASQDRPALTGTTFGGDKVDYDTGRLTPLHQEASSWGCDFCGGSLAEHKMYEDDDVRTATDQLFEILAQDRKGSGVWQPKGGHDQRVMTGICRLTNGHYLAAFSGYDKQGEARFREDVESRLASKRNQKNKWHVVDGIPDGADMIRTRNAHMTIFDLQKIFGSSGLSLPQSLHEMHCAAPKMLYHLYNVFPDRGSTDVAALTEVWWEPANAKTFASSVGKAQQVIRRHGQTVPSCTRCSVAVRVFRCPN